MKYRAVLRLGYNVISRKFDTVGDAEQWILSENNNMDSTSYIQQLDDNDNVVDWFYYSKKKE